MKELIKELNNASYNYYVLGKEIISNYEYDKKYDELVKMEEDNKIIYPNSPTVNVGYEVVSSLKKEKHETKMLSLNKTKDEDELKEWLGDKVGLLSWKMDGLTVVLTYNNGVLQKAVTRGNGEIGEVITNNAKTFINVPTYIDYQDKLVIRGEAVISYSNFEKINSLIEKEEDKYKNPRNLCSGTVRQLDSKITASRNVEFFAFELVDKSKAKKDSCKGDQLNILQSLGFDIVESMYVDNENFIGIIEDFSNRAKNFYLPVDGLVLTYDNIEYSQSLGNTSKFPKDSMAFKWADELIETTLKEVEWSASRTGLLNPVAIFETVEIEGTSVSRASLHNISILEELELGIGDKIMVYKANLIIPQVYESVTKSNNIEIPKICPICGGVTKIVTSNNTKTLICTNPNCIIKKSKAFSLFVSRDAMNINGLSDSTLDKLIEHGFISKFSDIFQLEKYRDEIQKLDGFGKKSTDKLLTSIENSRRTTMDRLLYGLGIPNSGRTTARMIVVEFGNDFSIIKNLTENQLSSLDGFGEVIAKSFVEYFSNKENVIDFDNLFTNLIFEDNDNTIDKILEGLTFVITGSLELYKDRSALKEEIESLGGKTSGSVSKNTDYLINNDSQSMSAKNKKAKDLGVTILTEKDFKKYLDTKMDI